MGTILTPQSAQKTNKTWEQSWDCPNAECEWSNFSNDQWSYVPGEPDINQLYSKHSDPAFVAYVAEKEKGFKGNFAQFKESTKGFDWGQAGNNLLGFFNTWQANKNNQTQPAYTDTTDKDKKSNTGLYVGIGAGVILLGFGIWYLVFKQK